jgi:hypothetical protein
MKRAIAAFGRFLAGVDWGTVMRATFSALTAVLKGFGSVLLGIATVLGKDLLHGLRVGAGIGWTALKGWLNSLPGMIKGAIGDLGRLLFSAGVAAIQGLWDGMKSQDRRHKDSSPGQEASLLKSSTRSRQACGFGRRRGR